MNQVSFDTVRPYNMYTLYEVQENVSRFGQNH